MNNHSQIATPWGDRRRLLPKAMSYAVSLDFKMVARQQTPWFALEGPTGCLRHVFDQEVITSPEGASCDVPRGTIVGGDGEYGDRHDLSPAWLKLRLTVDLNQQPVPVGESDKAPLRVVEARDEKPATATFECLGVINFAGGLRMFQLPDVRTISGSTFIATNHECPTAAYRWLNRRQLFGVGRVTGQRADASGGGSSPKADWLLHFRFDLHLAA